MVYFTSSTKERRERQRMIDRLLRPARRPGPDPAATLAHRRQFMTFVWPLYALGSTTGNRGRPCKLSAACTDTESRGPGTRRQRSVAAP